MSFVLLVYVLLFFSHSCFSLSLSAFIIAKGTVEAKGGQVTTKVYELAKYLREAGF